MAVRSRLYHDRRDTLCIFGKHCTAMTTVGQMRKGGDQVVVTFDHGHMGMCEPCASDPASRDGVANRPIRSAPSQPNVNVSWLLAKRTRTPPTRPLKPLRAPAFDLNDPVLQAIIAQAVAAALVRKQSQERANDIAKTDTALVKAFEKAGYKNITLFDRTKLLSQQPDVTALTYNRWIELGRKVKTGEKSRNSLLVLV
jgi:hypothetical protein